MTQNGSYLRVTLVFIKKYLNKSMIFNQILQLSETRFTRQ